MEKWAVDWANDPNDDYNLIMEIVYNYSDVAIIYQRKHGLVIKWYSDFNGVAIPVEWFSDLLLTAKKDLNDSEAMMVEVVTNRWVADWTSDYEDNYNCIIKILCDEEVVAIVKQSAPGLILQWCVSPKGLTMPVDWLSELLLEAKSKMSN